MTEIVKIEPRVYYNWHRGINNKGPLRYGQAFLNALFPKVADPQLFYQTDQQKAIDRILELYVDTSQ